MQIGIFVVGGLLVANVVQAMTTTKGPPAELEALHSAAEAEQICREGIRTRLESSRPTLPGPLEVDYLGGGEYEITGVVEVRENSGRAQRPVLCVAQYVTADAGWRLEDVEIDMEADPEAGP